MAGVLLVVFVAVVLVMAVRNFRLCRQLHQVQTEMHTLTNDMSGMVGTMLIRQSPAKLLRKSSIDRKSAVPLRRASTGQIGACKSDGSVFSDNPGDTRLTLEYSGKYADQMNRE